MTAPSSEMPPPAVIVMPSLPASSSPPAVRLKPAPATNFNGPFSLRTVASRVRAPSPSISIFLPEASFTTEPLRLVAAVTR